MADSRQQGAPVVLILDDDALHLKLYRWIIEHGGFSARTVQICTGTNDLPSEGPADIALLDYRLRCVEAAEIAERLRNTFPSLPIVVLSELAWMPDDIQPWASAFVHKGDPKRLLQTIIEVLQRSSVA